MRIRRARRITVTLIALVGGLAASVDAQVPYPWYIVPGGGVGPIVIGMRDTDATSVLGPPAAFCFTTSKDTALEALATLYYEDRGLVVQTTKRDAAAAAEVGVIYIVNELARDLTDSQDVHCSLHGTVVMRAGATPYITHDGIGLGTPVQRVLAAMGVPKKSYPASPNKPASIMTNDELATVFIHALFFVPPQAQIYGYDGILFGVAESRVVSIGILRKRSAAPRPGG